MTLLGLLGLACGPTGPSDYQAADEVSASEACHAVCDVRATCDPTANDPNAAECFDTCMSLPLADDQACESAYREVYMCIGALDCEGYERTMSGASDQDPCADAKLDFAELECGVGAPP